MIFSFTQNIDSYIPLSQRIALDLANASLTNIFTIHINISELSKLYAYIDVKNSGIESSKSLWKVKLYTVSSD